MVGFGIDLLGGIRGQPFHQLLRRLAVWRGFRHRNPRNIHMCAAVFKNRKHDADCVCRFGLLGIRQHLPNVIGIADRNIALACPDRLDLIAVAALGFAGQIGLYALQPIGGV